MSSIEDDIKDDIIKSEKEQKTDLANTCEILLNDKWRKRKSILRDRSIATLSTLDTLAELYDVEFLKTWINNYTEYVTSINGKGRQDIVEIAKYSIERENEKNRELMQLLGKR